MVVLQKFLGVILKSCLFMDRFFLRAVDWVISSGVPMRFFSDRVWGVRSNISLRRGIIYSLLSLFVVAVGLYCGDSDKSKGLLAKPDKVSNFEITSGNALITISWDATEGASEYKIFMDDDSGTSKLLDMPKETGEKSYSKPFSKGLEGVAMENGIRYAFQILARNSAGEGDKSDKAYGMPRPENLGTLGRLRADPAPTQATLTWDVNSLATKYIVHRKTSSDTFFNEIETVTKEECSAEECMYVDTGLTNNTNYNYKVIAVMVIDGDGLEAAEVKSLNDASALTSARPRSLSDRQVRVTHTVNAMRSLTDGARINLKIREPISLGAVLIRGYEIETLTETGDPLIPNVPVITIRTLSPSTTKSVDQPYGLARQYRVTAQSGQGQSLAPISDSQNTIDVPAILPDAPSVSDFMVSGVTAVKSDLSWSTTGRATHYTLQRTSGGSTHALFTKMEKADLTKMGSKYTFTDTHNLGQGQSYTYDLIPIISGLNVDGVQGIVATQSGTTPTDPLKDVVLENLVQYVNPFMGIGQSRSSGGGLTGSAGRIPGATTPFGMVQFTPRSYNLDTGINYSSFKHFALTMLAGPGCPTPSAFQVKFNGSAASTNMEIQNGVSPGDDNLQAEPGYYKMVLKDKTLIELIALPRVGFARITYPSTEKAIIEIPGSNSDTALSEGGQVYISEREHHDGFCAPDHNEYEIFMVGRFSSSFTEGGNGTFSRNQANAVDGGVGAFTWATWSTYNEPRKTYTFSTTTVLAQFGISYVSKANAKQNLTSEVTAYLGAGNEWNFDRAKKIASDMWNEKLNTIQVDTEDGNLKKMFYTSMYFSLLHPNKYNDVKLDAEDNPVPHKYKEFDNSIVSLKDRQHDQYANYSGWDIYRSQSQITAFVDPRSASDLAQSLINNSDHTSGNGYPRWPVANDDSETMVGDPGAIILVNYYAFGGRAFDLVHGLRSLNRQGNAGDNSVNTGHPITNAGRQRRKGLRGGKRGSTAVNGHNVGQDEFLEVAAADFSRWAYASSQPVKKAWLAANSGKSQAEYQTEFIDHLRGDTDKLWQIQFNSNGLLSGSSDPGIRLNSNKDGYESTTQSYNGNKFTECGRTCYQWMIPFHVKGVFSRRLNSMVQKTGEQYTATRTVTSSIGISRVLSELDNYLFIKKWSSMNDNEKRGHQANVCGGENDSEKICVTSLLADDHKNPNIFIGNEPGFSALWLYNHTNQAYKTDLVVQKMPYYFGKVSNLGVNGSLPGNDDLGALSALFTMSAIGLFPSIPGLGVLQIAKPLFNRVTLRLRRYESTGPTTSGYTPIKTVQISIKSGSTGAFIKKIYMVNPVTGVQEEYQKNYITYDRLFEGYNGMGLEMEYELTDSISEARSWTPYSDSEAYSGIPKAAPPTLAYGKASDFDLPGFQRTREYKELFHINCSDVNNNADKRHVFVCKPLTEYVMSFNVDCTADGLSARDQYACDNQ